MSRFAQQNPFSRNDLWATGFYDFLWRPGISENYRKRLDKIKAEAIEKFQHNNIKPKE